MSFYPPPRPVPTHLLGDEFAMEPLTEAHVEVDYAAVMESREYLRLWSGTSWPADDFTLEGNRQDLARHDREHRERDAFTYTILSPDRTTCLGCVYINPVSKWRPTNPGVADVAADAAAVDFWVRASRQADRLDERVLTALTEWLSTSWEFSVFFFVARRGNVHHRDLLDKELSPVKRVEIPKRGDYLLYPPEGRS
jgi:hypothetical protein